MTKFIKSPLFDNWLEINKPKNNLLICSPYFKASAFEKISKNYDLSNRPINIEVLLRGKLEDFIQGSSDISALEALIRLKNLDIDNVKRLTNLHMKAYLIDHEKLLIGSGNCTYNGLFAGKSVGNVEGAIATEDKKIISDFNDYYQEILESGESLNVFYDKITKGYEEHIDKYSPKIGDEIKDLINKKEKQIQYKFPIMPRIEADNTFKEFYAAEIPQFSKFEAGAYKTPEIVLNNDGLSFVELGEILRGPGKTIITYRKYGENQSKFAEFLDFVTITNERPRRIHLTKLGKSFLNSTSERKIEILKTQIFRMPIVKHLIKIHSEKKFNLEAFLLKYIAPSTVTRRASSIRSLFKFLKENKVNEVDSVLEKLKKR